MIKTTDRLMPQEVGSLTRLSRMEVESVFCNCCRRDSAVPLFANDSHGFGLRTVACRGCGLVYLNPRPTQAEYARLYSEEYEALFPNAWSLCLAREKAERRIVHYREHLADCRHLLEIGPGDGAFLELVQCKFRACAVLGLEPSPKAIEACARRGVPVRAGYIDQLSNKKHSFDTVAAFHILEHATDPLGLLRQLRAHLRPEGVLLLEVPNILGSWSGLGMLHIAHPYQFSPRTLARVVRQAGFEVVELAALEERRFESSIRMVAKPSDSALEFESRAGDGDEIETLRNHFRPRLNHWRLDLFRYRMKRALMQSPPLAAWKRRRFARQLQRLTPPEFEAR